MSSISIDDVREDIFDEYIVASNRENWSLAERLFSILQRYEKRYHPEYYKERPYKRQYFEGHCYVDRSKYKYK